MPILIISKVYFWLCVLYKNSHFDGYVFCDVLKMEKYYTRKLKNSFWYWLDRITIIMPGSANFEILTEKIFCLCFELHEVCPKLFCGLGIDHPRRKIFHRGTLRGRGVILQNITVCLVSLCDDLVVFKLWAGVKYSSFSIDAAPQWIMWKRNREDLMR